MSRSLPFCESLSSVRIPPRNTANRACTVTQIPGRDVFVQKRCQLVVLRCHREQRTLPLKYSEERAVIGSPCCPSLLPSGHNRGRQNAHAKAVALFGAILSVLPAPKAPQQGASRTAWTLGEGRGGERSGSRQHGAGPRVISVCSECLWMTALLEKRSSRKAPRQAFEWSALSPLPKEPQSV